MRLAPFFSLLSGEAFVIVYALLFGVATIAVVSLISSIFESDRRRL
jgi:hypothetical protein